MQPRALVIGGTGPTGPFVVAGLLERGYDVTILHGGHHEIELPPVRHLHADPHFRETLTEALGTETFDVVIAQYGRLRITSEVLRGRTERLIAIGGATGIYADEGDPRWGALGRPALFPDTTDLLYRNSGPQKLLVRMAEAMEALFSAHADGAYHATYVGYPTNYGPRQPGPTDWCVVRRVLDGRGRIIVADGGIKLESRLAVENAAHAVLCVLDHPDLASGQRYAVADERVYSLRQRIEGIAALMGHELELVDMPYDVAWPCHPLWRHRRGHDLCQSGWIREHLGFADALSTEDGLERSVRWLIGHRLEPGGEEEQKIGDPFDYAAEDALLERWASARSGLGPIEPQLPERAHIYRHPRRPGEPWRHPSGG